MKRLIRGLFLARKIYLAIFQSSPRLGKVPFLIFELCDTAKNYENFIFWSYQSFRVSKQVLSKSLRNFSRQIFFKLQQIDYQPAYALFVCIKYGLKFRKFHFRSYQLCKLSKQEFSRSMSNFLEPDLSRSHISIIFQNCKNME